MLDIKRVRIFAEVVRRGSFSAAAAALSYTQPAVSHHVAQLELEMGVKLLDRGPRGIQLTPAGTELVGHAAGILERVAAAESAMGELASSGGGRLRLGSFPTASAAILPQAIARLRILFPRVRTTLSEGEPPETIARLRAQEIDIGLIFDSLAYPIEPDDQLVVQHLLDDPMMVAMPAAHELCDRPSLSLAELADEPWIEGAGATTPCSLILSDACRRAGFNPQVVFSSGDYQVVKQLVAAEVGIALIPRLATLDGADGVVFRALEHECPHRRVSVLTRNQGQRSEPLAAVLSMLAEIALRPPLRDVNLALVSVAP